MLNFDSMLTTSEEAFLNYWSKIRTGYKTSIKPLLIGLSIGFAIGTGILLVIYLGWYERANMQANTQFSPILFLISIMGISIFMAFIYRNYQWENNEQRYLQINAKLSRLKKNQANAAIDL